MLALKVVLMIELILLASIYKCSEGLISHAEPIYTCFYTFGRWYQSQMGINRGGAVQ